MTVYVDNALIPMGRMKMCHMLADTTEELLDMAAAIGLASHHLQGAGEDNEHFDVSMTYRAKAVAKGAVEVDSRGLVKLIRDKRRARAQFQTALDAATLETTPGLNPDRWGPDGEDLFLSSPEAAEKAPSSARPVRIIGRITDADGDEITEEEFDDDGEDE